MVKKKIENTPEDIAKVLKLRRDGVGYLAICVEMGWKKDRGYRAYAIIRKSGARNVDLTNRAAKAKKTRDAKAKLRTIPADTVPAETPDGLIN